MKTFKSALTALVFLTIGVFSLSPAMAQVDPTGEEEAIPSTSAASSVEQSGGGSAAPDSNQQFITGAAVGAGVGVVLGGILGWVLKRDPR